MWDVLYAIDASTSMGQASRNRVGASFVKVDEVRRAILETVNPFVFPFGSRVGAMAFRGPTKAMGTMLDSSKDVAQDLLDLTPVADLWANPALLRDNLDSLRVGGVTPTGEGLRRAVEMVHPEQREGKKRIKKVILVTDEKSNAGPRPDRLLDEGLVRRAIVDVVSLGKEGDKRSLSTIASKTGGKYTRVEDHAELATALKPRIPYVAGYEPTSLLQEAERVSTVLKATESSSASYKGIATAAAAVRSKVEVKLKELATLEGQSRAYVDMVVSEVTHDPKWPSMSMREFADRVWSSEAELEKYLALGERHRQALRSLSP